MTDKIDDTENDKCDVCGTWFPAKEKASTITRTGLDICLMCYRSYTKTETASALSFLEYAAIVRHRNEMHWHNNSAMVNLLHRSCASCFDKHGLTKHQTVNQKLRCIAEFILENAAENTHTKILRAEIYP